MEGAIAIETSDRSENSTKEFAKEAVEQANAAAHMRVASQLRSRLDLRGKTIFTFSSTPFNLIKKTNFPFRKANGSDDIPGLCCAFSLDKKGDVFQLGVHIADVDEYVNEGSPLDLEAKNRGLTINNATSFVPMLHEGITFSACSFTEGEDKLAVSVFLDIDKNGTLINLHFEESIVRIAKNCIFSEIDRLYSSADTSSALPLREKYAALLTNMNEMYNLSGLLFASRLAGGDILLNTNREFFNFNDNSEAESFELLPQYDSKLMIQEFLYFASLSLARHMAKNHFPCIYNSRKIKRESLLQIAKTIELYPINEETTEKELLKTILDKAELSSDANSVLSYLSTTISPANYTVDPQQCGLLHNPILCFSNPVGNYADLTMQRAMKAIIRAKGMAECLNVEKTKKKLNEISIAANDAELRARTLENDAKIKCLLQIMNNHPGESFPALLIESGENNAEIFFDVGVLGKIQFDEKIKAVNERSFIADDKLYTVGQHVKVKNNPKSNKTAFYLAQ